MSVVVEQFEKLIKELDAAGTLDVRLKLSAELVIAEARQNNKELAGIRQTLENSKAELREARRQLTNSREAVNFWKGTFENRYG